jgi:hypothetical protein
MNEAAIARTSLLAKDLAGRVVNEVYHGASQTYHGRVTVFLILWRICQPMLHVHPGARASK